MKPVKIRGTESQGMICSEDEIGLGESHAGIVVLPNDARTGSAVAGLFPVYTDWIYEIGLTPNRMDAMSHQGVARDVCVKHAVEGLLHPSRGCWVTLVTDATWGLGLEPEAESLARWTRDGAALLTTRGLELRADAHPPQA